MYCSKTYYFSINMKRFKKFLLQLMNSGRKGRTLSTSISHHGDMFLQTENSGTMFICKITENYSKNHVFDPLSPRNGKGAYTLSYECINEQYEKHK